MQGEITPDRKITRLVALHAEEIKHMVLKKLLSETTLQCSNGSTFFYSTFSRNSNSTEPSSPKAPLPKGASFIFLINFVSDSHGNRYFIFSGFYLEIFAASLAHDCFFYSVISGGNAALAKFNHFAQFYS